MNDNKSITKYQKVYIITLIILLMLQLFAPSLVIRHILLLVLLLFLLLPSLLILQYTTKKKLLVQYFLSLLLVIFLLALSFRKLRDVLSVPDFTHSGMVGYAQYFGYPLYLDTILFFCLFLYPLAFFLLMGFRKKIEKK